MVKSDFEKTKMMVVSVGMSDQISLKENYKAGDILKSSAEYFKIKKIPFSSEEVMGAYSLTTGDYVSEHGVQFTFINPDRKAVLEFCDYLKTHLNQESILIQESEIEVQYVV